jgi:hypothetical protein
VGERLSGCMVEVAVARLCIKVILKTVIVVADIGRVRGSVL